MKTHANSFITIVNENDDIELISYIISIFKIFILFFIGVSLLFGAYQSITKGSISGFIDGGMVGFFSSIVVIPILSIIDIVQKIKCIYKFKKKNIGLEQNRNLTISCKFDSAFEIVINVLNRINYIKSTESDRNEGTICAVTKSTWRSFGEIIVINLYNISDNKTGINLASKSKIPITMIDYCKNFENVETFLSLLESEATLCMDYY